jgi:type IV pilus assembly protein PilY1
VKQLARDDGSRDFYFTDGSPVVSDAWFYSSPTASLPTDKNLNQWHTVAVAGMRQGGNQYFALDITNPADANYPGYLWEFPAEGAAASITQWMGQTWSEPIITKVRLAVDGDLLNPQERWVVIFAGGYAESGDPNKPLYDLQATAGRSITMLDLKTGQIVAQKKFVDTTAPAETDPTTIVYDPLNPEASMAFALASTPGVFDVDADGFADLVYVGDLGGNLWKWVITNVGHDPVNSSGLPSTSQPAWHFEKFFAAPVHTHSGTGQKHYKSFFFNPSATLKSGELWLAFGSGERADLAFAGYPAPEDENNRFYSVKDLDPLASSPSGVPMGETTLFDITGDASCADVASFDGLFFKAVDGEKFVTASDIFFYYAFVASFTPTTSTDPCESAGNASLYAFKVYCGEGLFDDGSGNPVLNIDLGDGMPTDPKVSLSGDQSQVFINKKDEVLAPPVPFKLDEAGGSAVWRERHED